MRAPSLTEPSRSSADERVHQAAGWRIPWLVGGRSQHVERRDWVEAIGPELPWALTLGVFGPTRPHVAATPPGRRDDTRVRKARYGRGTPDRSPPAAPRRSARGDRRRALDRNRGWPGA